MAKPWATPDELAEWLQVPVATLARLRRGTTGPKFLRVGREVRYAWADVHTWCAGRRTTNGG